MRAGEFLGFEDGGGAEADGHPAVAVAGGAADGGAGVAADPDGGVGFLRRFGGKAAAGNLVKLAVKGGVVLGPEFFVELDVFVGYGAALGVGVEAEGLEFLLHPAYAGA